MTMEITFELVGKNKQWILNQPEVMIGRESGCDIRLSGDEFPTVSRFHAAIRFKNGNYFVEDANSPNGTFVNGKRVQETKLASSDIIRLGNGGPELKIRFVPEASAAELSPTVTGGAAAAAGFAATIAGGGSGDRQVPSIGRSRAAAHPVGAPSPSSAPAAAAPARDEGNAEMIMLEQKLGSMQRLLLVILVVVVVLAGIVIYQGYLINQTEDTVVQMRRQATDAVSQFVPALDQRMTGFQKRADDMQAAMSGFDGKIKQAENEFIARMGKELPPIMDKYIQTKLDELKSGGLKPPIK